MQKKRLLALVLTLLSASWAQARAEGPVSEAEPQETDPGATIVEAQRLEVFLDRKLHAIGDAELHQGESAIFGDRIDYDTLNEELHATGNARLEQGGNTIIGPELRLKLREREGEMKEPVFTLRTGKKAIAAGQNVPQPQAAMQRKPEFSRGSASSLVFEGPDKETLTHARYTTCEAGNDDWYLRAGELELDHYTETATATHASIEFKGVPILYTPWIDFPFKNQRKSGFLSPTWATTSRSGFDFALPFYWNIAPNMDATITPRYMSKRGTQAQGEFRYLEENYFGEDHLEYLPNDNMTGNNRFYIGAKHTHIFGNGWSGAFNFERVSDDQYFSDMTTHIITTSLVNLQQQATLNYNSEHWNFNGLVQQYQTLDKVSYPYQRLPQLTLTGNKDWDFTTGNLYTQFVRFDRNSNAPANVTSVTGNRFVAYPSISAPFGESYGYITPKLGLHYTKYDLSGDTALYDRTQVTPTILQNNYYQSDSRALPIFSLDSGLYFDREMRVVKNSYTQTLEPRLFYVYIPHRDQSRIPVFDTAQADLNLGTLFSENQFVGQDRINDANQISLAVTSRLIDAKTGQQRLAVTVGQRFYFSDQKVTLPGVAPRSGNTSDIVTALTARLLNHWNLDAGWQFNTDTSTTMKSNISARYQPEPGKVLNLSYRYTKSLVDQIDLSSEWPLGGNWYALGRVNYSFLDNPLTPGREKGMIESLAGTEYDAGCWQARAVMQRVSTATATANYALFFQLELGGMASIGTSPLALLKRNIPGYTSSGLIPDNFQQH